MTINVPQQIFLVVQLVITRAGAKGSLPATWKILSKSLWALQSLDNALVPRIIW